MERHIDPEGCMIHGLSGYPASVTHGPSLLLIHAAYKSKIYLLISGEDFPRSVSKMRRTPMRTLAELEDALVDAGVPEDVAESMVDEFETAVVACLDEFSDEEPEDADGPVIDDDDDVGDGGDAVDDECDDVDDGGDCDVSEADEPKGRKAGYRVG